MVNNKLLNNYIKDVAELKESAKSLGLNTKEFNTILKESFIELINKKNVNKSKKVCTNFRNVFVLFIIILLFIYVLLNVHQPTSSIVLRNVQGLTYPALKIVRFLSVPVIKLFPALTDLYDETCLLENPYFWVSDMECWPCEGIYSILNISKVDKNYVKSGYSPPFITKLDQQEVTLNTLKTLYNQNKHILNAETRRLSSTNSSMHQLKDLFEADHEFPVKTHISWRITKMETARLIRRVFPKPYFLPERSGQSVERFVMFDGAESEPYILPNTECSYVFMIQGSGERSILMKSSRECGGSCKTLSVELKPSYALWYNWWYWRPVSLPVINSTEPSITYLNSYC